MATLRVVGALRDVPQAAWDALVAGRSPFLEWEWLNALEETAAVGAETGWLPQHLTIWEGERAGRCLPALREGAQPRRVRLRPRLGHGRAPGAHPVLSEAARGGAVHARHRTREFWRRPERTARSPRSSPVRWSEYVEEQGFSSVHVNFCLDDDREALEARGWLPRIGYQYQWVNRGLRLRSTTTWRACAASGATRSVASGASWPSRASTIETLVGEAIPMELAPLAYRLYRITVDTNPWGQRYLNERLFELLFERWRSRLCLVLARRGGEVIAGTINVQNGDVLYGRYWGAFATAAPPALQRLLLRRHRALHRPGAARASSPAPAASSSSCAASTRRRRIACIGSAISASGPPSRSTWNASVSTSPERSTGWASGQPTGATAETAARQRATQRKQARIGRASNGAAARSVTRKNRASRASNSAGVQRCR